MTGLVVLDHSSILPHDLLQAAPDEVSDGHAFDLGEYEQVRPQLIWHADVTQLHRVRRCRLGAHWRSGDCFVVRDVVARPLGTDRPLLCGFKRSSTWVPLDVDARDVVEPVLLQLVRREAGHRIHRDADVQQDADLVAHPVEDVRGLAHASVLAGSLRELGSGTAEVPAHELTNESSAVLSDLLSGLIQVVPKVLLKPHGAVLRDLPGLWISHVCAAYGLYVHWREQAPRSHACHCTDSGRTLATRGRPDRPVAEKGGGVMSDSMQVGSDELAALRARLVADVACERCGEIDPWQRCRD